MASESSITKYGPEGFRTILELAAYEGHELPPTSCEITVSIESTQFPVAVNIESDTVELLRVRIQRAADAKGIKVDMTSNVELKFKDQTMTVFKDSTLAGYGLEAASVVFVAQTAQNFRLSGPKLE